MLGDIEEGRPNLGPLVHVAVYRLMQFTLRDILIRDYGVEDADRIFFEAGKNAGEEYCKNVLTDKSNLTSFFAEIQRTMKELGIGIFRVESADYEKGSFVVTVAEELDYSGIPVCSEEICTLTCGSVFGGQVKSEEASMIIATNSRYPPVLIDGPCLFKNNFWGEIHH
jgi:uncharacterized protein